MNFSMHLPRLVPPIAFAICLTACGSSSDNTDNTTSLPDFTNVVALGGDTTTFTTAQSSFGFDTPAVNLKGEALELHLQGDADFEAAFTRTPNPGFPDLDGVGPVFNNNACLQCHARDGRGNFSIEAKPGQWTKLGVEEALFLRISIGPEQGKCIKTIDNCFCEPQAVPGFSSQLFHRGVLDLRPDSEFTGQADVYVDFELQEVEYADGEKVTLQKPIFEIRNPYDNPGEKPGDNTPPVSRLLQADVKTSPRMGMPMFGLGLLEAISEQDILALADVDDKDGDGISGKPNFVCDQTKILQGDANPMSLGRFGWKASTPSVAVQGSGAYRGDIGITNYFFPQESIEGTTLMDAYRSRNPVDTGMDENGNPEVNEATVKAVMFYSNTLAVPARRKVDDPQVQRGAVLFQSADCVACHNPSFTTGEHPGIWGPSGVVEIPQVANQKIYPFTDMLLHDMGDGLADNRTDFDANGKEWKTRPLWGIGLTHTVNPLATFLHDARAKTLAEAILWHGGEAENAKQRFRTMSKADRDALIAFLNSL